MNIFLKNLLHLHRHSWEVVASVFILIGAGMLLQSFSMWLFTYSFIVVLFGTVMFIIVSHFPEGDYGSN